MANVNVETEIELLKREVSDMKQIHVRLDTAIEKIADVSSSLHTVIAVHEEKLARQEENLDEQEKQLRNNIQDLHSRITTNAKETHTPRSGVFLGSSSICSQTCESCGRARTREDEMAAPRDAPAP